MRFKQYNFMGSEGDFAGINWDSYGLQGKVLAAMIGGVPILEGAYAQYEFSKRNIGSVFAKKQHPFTNEFYNEEMGNASLKDTFPKIKDACIELSKEVKLAGGYSVRLENRFAYDEYDVFFGLFLTVFDSKKMDEFYSEISDLPPEQLRECTVGVLGFQAGFPFVIHTIQGNNGKAPQEFYKKTGKHFDDVLMARMIEAIGCNMQFDSQSPLRKIRRIAFNLYELPSKGVENRLLQLAPRKYVDAEARKNIWGVKVPKVYVRNRFLARANRKMHAQKIPV